MSTGFHWLKANGFFSQINQISLVLRFPTIFFRVNCGILLPSLIIMIKFKLLLARQFLLYRVDYCSRAILNQLKSIGYAHFLLVKCVVFCVCAVFI